MQGGALVHVDYVGVYGGVGQQGLQDLHLVVCVVCWVLVLVDADEAVEKRRTPELVETVDVDPSLEEALCDLGRVVEVFGD